MTINDQIRNEKLQYDVNREAAKISALSNKQNLLILLWEKLLKNK